MTPLANPEVNQTPWCDGRWNGLEVASSELLAQRSLLTRVDRKFVASERSIEQFVRGLGDDYRVVVTGNSGWARYETCYFDTPDLETFHEHVRGRRPRFKVRIRHHVDRHCSFLEIKKKNNSGKTAKARRERSFSSTTLTDDDREFIAKWSGLNARQLDVAVWTNFKRATFVGVRTNERITVDVGLRFQRESRLVDSVEFGIVELKQPRILHSTPAALLLRQLGIREQSLSKYCTGVARIHEAALPRDRLTVSRALARIKT